jgi:hypothetical protein
MALFDIPFELYDATKSATQSYDYHCRAVQRRNELHKSNFTKRDEAAEPPRLRKANMWPMVAGSAEEDEDRLAFEALRAKIALTVKDYKSYNPVVEDVVKYWEPKDDFEITWCKQFADTV